MENRLYVFLEPEYIGLWSIRDDSRDFSSRSFCSPWYLIGQDMNDDINDELFTWKSRLLLASGYCK